MYKKKGESSIYIPYFTLYKGNPNEFLAVNIIEKLFIMNHMLSQYNLIHMCNKMTREQCDIIFLPMFLHLCHVVWIRLVINCLFDNVN